MTTLEAATLAGLAPYTIKHFARKGAFGAVLLRGRRGGYDIDPRSFEIWMIRRRIKTGNAPARAQARRDLKQMGVLVCTLGGLRHE